VRTRQGHRPTQSWIPGQIVPADHAAPPVTIPGGHPHAQPHPGHPNRIPATALGLTRSGQPGSPETVYRHHGPDSIIRAALDLAS